MFYRVVLNQQINILHIFNIIAYLPFCHVFVKEEKQFFQWKHKKIFRELNFFLI